MNAASIVTELATRTFHTPSRSEQQQLQVLVQSAAREGVTSFALMRERLLLRAGLSDTQSKGNTGRVLPTAHVA